MAGRELPACDDRGHREAVEAELTVELLDGVYLLLKSLGLPWEAWPRIPALAQVLRMAAASALADRLQDGGATAETARLEVEVRLGIPAKTVETWLRRWQKAAA